MIRGLLFGVFVYLPLGRSFPLSLTFVVYESSEMTLDGDDILRNQDVQLNIDTDQA